MAILYGTTAEGETRPILVNAAGSPLATGMQGPPGEQGQPGQEGPPGPPGPPVNLPPDPWEGALLGWLGGELAWIGTPPSPIPPGVFGPISAWDPDTGLMTLDGEFELVAAQYIDQCNPDGTLTGYWNMAKKWSDQVTPTGAIYSGTPENIFNGSTDVDVGISANQELTLLEDELLFASSIRVYTNASANAGVFKVNGSAVTDDASGPWKWVTLTGFTDPVTSLSIQDGYNFGCSAVEINGQVLVDGPANTSQLWSSDTDGTVFESSNPVTNAYDGNLATYARIDDSGSPSISVFNEINSSDIVVYGALDAPAGGKIYLRDASGTFVNVTSQFTSASATIERVEITGVTGISGFKLESTSTGPRIAAIEVNGSMLIDLVPQTGRISSVQAPNLLVVPDNSFTVGKYVKSQEILVARWLTEARKRKANS